MTPTRVRMMRRVRALLREGLGTKEIMAATGACTDEIVVQRTLIAIVDGTNLDRKRAARSVGALRSHARKSRDRAEVSGDLCDILAAPPSRRDLSLAYASED